MTRALEGARYISGGEGLGERVGVRVPLLLQSLRERGLRVCVQLHAKLQLQLVRL